MHSKNQQAHIKKLGLITYQEAWSLQETLFNEIVAMKLANQKLATPYQKLTPNYLLFCEHPHVYTMGKSGLADHLLVSKGQLKEQEVAFYNTNRGGDITYHGPGQLVLYPILDLENFFTDIHHYLRLLEEVVIATLQDFGICAGRIKGLTGVWVDHEENKNARKVCAIGVRISRWVTMHGMALNVYPDLTYFDQIVPCGIQGKKVTSIAAELGSKPTIQAVTESLEKHILRLFGMEQVAYF